MQADVGGTERANTGEGLMSEPSAAQVARAAGLLREDSELGGLVQFLVAYLQFKGLSLADIDADSCAAAARDAGGRFTWAGWWAETFCWLHQPGVLDLVVLL